MGKVRPKPTPAPGPSTSQHQRPQRTRRQTWKTSMGDRDKAEIVNPLPLQLKEAVVILFRIDEKTLNKAKKIEETPQVRTDHKIRTRTRKPKGTAQYPTKARTRSKTKAENVVQIVAEEDNILNKLQVEVVEESAPDLQISSEISTTQVAVTKMSIEELKPVKRRLSRVLDFKKIVDTTKLEKSTDSENVVQIEGEEDNILNKLQVEVVKEAASDLQIPSEISTTQVPVTKMSIEEVKLVKRRLSRVLDVQKIVDTTKLEKSTDSTSTEMSTVQTLVLATAASTYVMPETAAFACRYCDRIIKIRKGLVSHENHHRKKGHSMLPRYMTENDMEELPPQMPNQGQKSNTQVPGQELVENAKALVEGEKNESTLAAEPIVDTVVHSFANDAPYIETPEVEKTVVNDEPAELCSNEVQNAANKCDTEDFEGTKEIEDATKKEDNSNIQLQLNVKTAENDKVVVEELAEKEQEPMETNSDEVVELQVDDQPTIETLEVGKTSEDIDDGTHGTEENIEKGVKDDVNEDDNEDAEDEIGNDDYATIEEENTKIELPVPQVETEIKEAEKIETEIKEAEEIETGENAGVTVEAVNELVEIEQESEVVVEEDSDESDNDDVELNFDQDGQVDDDDKPDNVKGEDDDDIPVIKSPELAASAVVNVESERSLNKNWKWKSCIQCESCHKYVLPANMDKHQRLHLGKNLGINNTSTNQNTEEECVQESTGTQVKRKGRPPGALNKKRKGRPPGAKNKKRKIEVDDVPRPGSFNEDKGKDDETIEEGQVKVIPAVATGTTKRKGRPPGAKNKKKKIKADKDTAPIPINEENDNETFEEIEYKITSATAPSPGKAKSQTGLLKKKKKLNVKIFGSRKKKASGKRRGRPPGTGKFKSNTATTLKFQKKLMKSLKKSKKETQEFVAPWVSPRVKKPSSIARESVETKKEKKYSCDTCNFETSQRSKLLLHVRVHLAESQGKIPCTICGAIFSIESMFDRHVHEVHPHIKMNFVDEGEYGPPDMPTLEMEVDEELMTEELPISTNVVDTTQLDPEPEMMPTLTVEYNQVEPDPINKAKSVDKELEEVKVSNSEIKVLEEVVKIPEVEEIPEVVKSSELAKSPEVAQQPEELVEPVEEAAAAAAEAIPTTTPIKRPQPLHLRLAMEKKSRRRRGRKRLVYKPRPRKARRPPLPNHVQCEVCSKLCLRKNLERHMRVHTGERPYGCDVCGKRFSDNRGVKNHNCEKYLREQERMRLNVLNLETRMKTVLANSFHVPNPNPEAEIQDEEDSEPQIKIVQVEGNYSTPSNESLEPIIVSSKNDKQTLRCPKCKLYFVNMDKFAQHICLDVQESSLDQESNADNSAQATFRPTTQINPNMTTTKALCKLCGVWVSKKYIAQHMRIHSGFRPFSCSKCKRKFTDSRGLRLHVCDTMITQIFENTSNGRIRLYQCNFCPNQFKDLNSCLQHQQICYEKNIASASATDDRPDEFISEYQTATPNYQCKYCDQRFPNHKAFIIHLRTHEEALLSCSMCRVRLTSPAALRKHIDRVHPKQGRHGTQGHEDPEYMFQPKTKIVSSMPEISIVPSSQIISQETDALGPGLQQAYLSSANSNVTIYPHTSHSTATAGTSKRVPEVEILPYSARAKPKTKQPARPLKSDELPISFLRFDGTNSGAHMQKLASNKPKPAISIFPTPAPGTGTELSEQGPVTVILPANTVKILKAAGVQVEMPGYEIESNSYPQPKPSTSVVETTSPNKQGGQGRFTNKPRSICPHCKEIVPKNTLHSHMRLHSIELQLPYPCTMCPEAFVERSRLLAHMMTLHPHANLADEDKDDNGKAQAAAAVQRTHSSDQEIICPMVRENPRECIICGALFSQVRNRRKHESKQHGYHEATCETCGDIFESQEILVLHQKTHLLTSGNFFTCQFCPASFSQRGSLTKHGQMIHPERYNYKIAPSISKRKGQGQSSSGTRGIPSTITSGQVSQATTSIFPTWERQFQEAERTARLEEDPLGDFNITVQEGLTDDNDNTNSMEYEESGYVGEGDEVECPITVGGNSSSFQCIHCSKFFPTKNNLEKHVYRMHTGERKFRCDTCGKCFAESGQYNRHLKVHGDMIYSCEICLKRFNCTSNLARHKRLHLKGPVRGYVILQCPQCPNRYNNATQFQAHLKTHTSEKPYTCQHCGMGFIRESNLKTHINIHINENALAQDDDNINFLGEGESEEDEMSYAANTTANLLGLDFEDVE